MRPPKAGKCCNLIFILKGYPQKRPVASCHSPQRPIVKAMWSSGFLKPACMSHVLGLSPFTVPPSVSFDMVAVTQWCSKERDFNPLGCLSMSANTLVIVQGVRRGAI